MIARLLKWWPLLASALAIATLAWWGEHRYDQGYVAAAQAGQAALDQREREYAEQRAEIEAEASARYRAQVERGNEIAEQLASTRDELETARERARETITDVTTVYLPAPGAAPWPIPGCVFTRGWLREYNAALGASTDLPGAGASTGTAGTDSTTAAAAGSNARLLGSGVTPADILAHAQDYGAWARRNLAQLNALIDLLHSQRTERP